MKHTADVVWTLQLDVMNHINGGDPINESRRKIGTHANFVQMLEESARYELQLLFRVSFGTRLLRAIRLFRQDCPAADKVPRPKLKEEFQMKNVQVCPTRKIVIPNDRITKVLFSLTNAEYRQMIETRVNLEIAEMRKHRRYGKIISILKLSHDNYYSMPDPPDQFDLDVANVCMSEWEAGNRYVTYSTIYRSLTGKIGESDATPSKDQLAKIKHSLKKLMSVRVTIDLEQICIKLNYNNGKPIKFSDKIIPARFVDYTINGQKTGVIELTAESPLLKTAKLKNNQIISYDMALLNIPNQKNTPLNIALKHYALRRIIEVITHRTKMAHTITFTDVFDKCQITNADNKKKHRIRKFLINVFEHLVECGILTSYQMTKKAGAYYSIEFAFDNKKPKRAQAAKKKKVKKEPQPSKEVKTKPLEKSAEPVAESGKFWMQSAMPIMPTYQWQYCHESMPMVPWSTDISALMNLIKKVAFFQY